MTAPPAPALALAEGASAIVMDDGLQNPSVKKTLSLLVIDGGYGFGNGLLLPAGPLREPVQAAASRCQAAVLIGDDETGALEQLPASLPVYRAQLQPLCAESLARRPVIAFAGIGRPDKFFRSVLALGAELVDTHAYPDHHVYSAHDITTLLGQTSSTGAKLVTTAKDYVKLPPTACAPPASSCRPASPGTMKPPGKTCCIDSPTTGQNYPRPSRRGRSGLAAHPDPAPAFRRHRLAHRRRRGGLPSARSSPLQTSRTRTCAWPCPNSPPPSAKPS